MARNLSGSWPRSGSFTINATAVSYRHRILGVTSTRLPDESYSGGGDPASNLRLDKGEGRWDISDFGVVVAATNRVGLPSPVPSFGVTAVVISIELFSRE